MIPWWRHMASETWTRSTLIRTMSTKRKYSSMNLEASGHTQILPCRKWRLLLKWPIAVLFFVEKYLFIGLILMLWHRETHINPQRKPMNCRRPGGYQTHDLQTGATPPCSYQLSSTFASCHWNRVKKTQCQWYARGRCTGQLTTLLECTGVNFNTRDIYLLFI